MKLRYKIPLAIAAVLAIAIFALALVLSHDSPCEPFPDPSADATGMKAVVYNCYGSPEVLEVLDIEKPTPGADEVLVKVRNASVNPLDWHYMRGEPYFMRLMSGLGKPKDPRLGVDFAGTVEAVGANVTRFKPGDAVFGGQTGAFGQYLVTREDRNLVPIPPGVSFVDAASTPVAATTALQALRDTGQVLPGQKVLINGASGGVGTFAVQIAKALGAEVTGVCSTRNLELVRSIGADHVIDYKNEDYTQLGERYDLIIDMVGNHSLMENRAVLSQYGRLVIIGGPAGKWLGPMTRPAMAKLISPFIDQDLSMMIARLKQDDLALIGQMMVEGKVKPVIDQHFTLSEVPAAIEYSEDGHARGKILIDVEE